MLKYNRQEETPQNIAKRSDTNMATIPQFKTIRQTAATGILPEHLLRSWEKQGRLPCIYSGKKCLINFDKLVAQLNSQTSERGDIN